MEIVSGGKTTNRIPVFRVEAKGRKEKRHQPYYNQYHAVNSNRVTFYKKLKTDRRNLRSHLDSTTPALKKVRILFGRRIAK